MKQTLITTTLASALSLLDPAYAMTERDAAAPRTVVVHVSGIADALGVVRCGLYLSSEGFPTEPADARIVIEPARSEGVTCRFENVLASRIAIAVSHDRNSNGRTDTNFLGIPKEAWGVSRNVRPRLRAPKFTEATIELAANDREPVVRIEVAK